MVKSILIVGLGGFLGTAPRFLISLYFQIYSVSVFPWGTFSVNIIGSFLIGIFLRFATYSGLSFFLGFGASSIIHSYKNILSFYASIKPDLEAMAYGCLVTIDETKVLLYKSGQKRP